MTKILSTLLLIFTSVNISQAQLLFDDFENSNGGTNLISNLGELLTTDYAKDTIAHWEMYNDVIKGGTTVCTPDYVADSSLSSFDLTDFHSGTASFGFSFTMGKSIDQYGLCMLDLLQI